MIVFTPYDSATGKLSGHIVTCEDGAKEYARLGYVWVDGQHDLKTYYILNGELAERPTSPVTRTDLTLSDVPAGSKLYINGTAYDAEGEVELEFPLPGTFSLRVECFPYLDWTDEVLVP